MNILFIFQDEIIPYMGGVQRVTYMLAEELISRGNKVSFLSTKIKSNNKNCCFFIAKQYYIDFSNPTDVIRKDYYNILKEENINIIINQCSLDDTLYLLSITPENIKKISCIHIQPFYNQDFPVELLKYMHINNLKEFLYVTFNRLFPFYYKKQSYNIEYDIINRTLVVSNYLCLLSKHFIPRILKFMPHVNKYKLVAVNNPVKIDKNSVQGYKKENLIIWVGRQSNFPKNIPAFIDIWNVISKNNKDWKAIIVGDGIDMKYNKDYAHKNNVKRLEFVGNQSDVVQYYKRAKFIGITSIYEGWGMVLTEAMSFGCVPFAYDTYESLHDIIEDGADGIIIEPFDKYKAANRLQYLIDNENKYRLMQNSAKEKVRSFSIDKIIDQWEKIFNL